MNAEGQIGLYLPPLRTERVLRLLGARRRVGISLELVPMAQLLKNHLAFALFYPSRRYRSALIGIIVHSSQSIVFGALVLLLVIR